MNSAISKLPSRHRPARVSTPLMKCTACPLVGEKVWHGVPAEAAERFGRARQQVAMRGNRTVYRPGDVCDAVYTVIDGSVVLGRVTPRGDRQAVHLVAPGGTFGYRALIEGGRRLDAAWCGRDSLLCQIPAAEAEAAFAVNANLEDIFLRGLADTLADAQDRMLRVATLGVRERLLLLLDSFLAPFSHTAGDAWLIVTPVRRADMAALAGMTPETLSRCIRRIEAENLARFSRHHILIPAPSAFQAAIAGLGGGRAA